jgi:F0F1-type ATP synthase assembly protein I
MPDEQEPTEAELEERLRQLLGEAESADSDELDEIELKLQGIEGKFLEQKEKREVEDSFFDAEFDERLKKLHEKADKAKTRRTGETTERKRSQYATGSDSRGLGIGLSIAYTITGMPLLGAGIGWLIDRAAGTGQWKGICMLAGAVIGLAMAFVMMNRTNDQK